MPGDTIRPHSLHSIMQFRTLSLRLIGSVPRYPFPLFLSDLFPASLSGLYTPLLFFISLYLFFSLLISHRLPHRTCHVELLENTLYMLCLHRKSVYANLLVSHDVIQANHGCNVSACTWDLDCNHTLHSVVSWTAEFNAKCNVGHTFINIRVHHLNHAEHL